jgi:hypothetical protein
MAWHGVARHVLACAGRRQLTTTWFDMATGSRSASARASYLEYGTGGAQGRACVRQLVALCWLAVGGDGCPGRQRHSSSSSCRYGRVRARFVKLLRLYIDYGYGMCRRRVLCDECECFHDGGRGVWGECTGVRPLQVLRTDSGGGSSVLASFIHHHHH